MEKMRLRVITEFEVDEYIQLLKSSENTGKTKQRLLKEAFFNSNLARPLMSKEMALKYLAEYRRMVDDFNKVARVINGGFRAGMIDTFDKIAEDLPKLLDILAYRKNPESAENKAANN